MGSTPSSRTSRLATPFDTLMSGLRATLNTCSGAGQRGRAARSGAASTMFFGISSPTTMLSDGRQREGDGHRRRPRRGALAEEAVQRRLDRLRDGRLGDEAEQQRDDREPELRAGQVVREPPVRPTAPCGRRRLPSAARRLEPAAVGGDDRELDRDEERGGQDQQE